MPNLETIMHTPTPWRTSLEPGKGHLIKSGHILVAKVPLLCGSLQIGKESEIQRKMAEEAESNLQFILTACNSHAALVSALTDLLDTVESASGLSEYDCRELLHDERPTLAKYRALLSSLPTSNA